LFRVVVRLFRHCIFGFDRLFVLRRVIGRASIFLQRFQTARALLAATRRIRATVFPLYFYCYLQWSFPLSLHRNARGR